jgi:hypothetical protein
MSRRRTPATNEPEPAQSDVTTSNNQDNTANGTHESANGNSSSNSSDSNTSFSWTRLIGVGIFFITFLVVVLSSWSSLPPPPSSGSSISNGWTGGYSFPPRSLDDAKSLGRQLSSYSSSNFGGVIMVYMVTYIFLQTFAIPGSIFLSILSGALFNFWLALFLVSLAAAVGASMANLLSSYLGRGIIQRYLGPRFVRYTQSEDYAPLPMNYSVIID